MLPHTSNRGRLAGRAATAFLALAAALSPVPLSAQTASQLTQESFAPPPQNLRGSLVFSGAPGLAAPEGSDRVSIQLAGVSVEGGLPGSAGAVAALRERLTRGRIPVSEIFAAAGELEASLARQGYVLARVVIPAQTLLDGGSLKLSIIDGFVEAIDAAGVPPQLRRRLAELTDPVIGRPGITLRELERRLLLAGDTYGVALGSALATGQRPGGTVIVLSPHYRRLTGFVGFDNTLSPKLGRVNFSSGIEVNGLFSLGEVIYIRASGHPKLGGGGYFSDQPQLRTLAAGVVMPVGTDGLTFSLEATSSKSRSDDAIVASASQFSRYSARLSYPFIRSGSTNLTFGMALDFQDDQQDLLTPFGALPIYHDRTRVLRLKADLQHRFSDGGNLFLGAQYSHGLDAFGARTLASATPLLPLSRDGADAEFRKLEINAAYTRALAENWALMVQGRGQTSFGKAMLSSEQFGVASTDAISPLAQGALSGDSGWVMRAEVSRSYQAEAFGLPMVASPFVFGAVGEVFLTRPTIGEPAREGASAFGLGIELALVRDPRFSSASLRAEIGRAMVDSTGDSNERFTLVGSFRF